MQKAPNLKEIKSFQHFISILARSVEHRIRGENIERDLEFWRQVQMLFYPELAINNLIDLYSLDPYFNEMVIEARKFTLPSSSRIKKRKLE